MEQIVEHVVRVDDGTDVLEIRTVVSREQRKVPTTTPPPSIIADRMERRVGIKYIDELERVFSVRRRLRERKTIKQYIGSD